MHVSVKFYAHLRELVGRKSRIDCELHEGATILQLLDELCRDAKIREHLLDENGLMKPDITILKNGREIKFLDGINTVLNHNDEISIFPMVAGG